MRNQARVLLVEGKDDFHVISSLMQAYEVPELFAIQETEGVEGLLARLPVQLKATDIERVGVVVDADVDLSTRWRSIRSILKSYGYADVPLVPSSEGTIVVEPKFPQFGAWLMPNNSLPGMLEDFAALLIPKDDPVAEYATSCVGEIPRQLFIDAHKSKAVMHTWLAWQADPGTPMGLAITKKYLDSGSVGAVNFVNWIKALFLR